MVAQVEVREPDGMYECDECAHVGSFNLPPEPKSAMHRRTLRAYLDEQRRTIAKRHRALTGCRSSRFTISFSLAPKQLVQIR